MRPSEQASILEYYGRRAREYERIYDKPERQRDLAALRALVAVFLADADVLEVACGTGYWTEVFASAARSVVATDSSDEVLEIARAKSYPPGRVTFCLADAFDLDPLGCGFTGGFAGFWWSHVHRDQLGRFLAGFHARLTPGARVLFIDNRDVEGSSTPFSRVDARGDTFQRRRLEDGSIYEVLKNFPDAEELEATVSGLAEEIVVTELPYYWALSYRVRG